MHACEIIFLYTQQIFKSPRDSCLFEAEKIGLELDYDPIGLDKNNLKCYTLATNSSRYKVTISKNNSCQCFDFSKKRTKQAMQRHNPDAIVHLQDS